MYTEFEPYEELANAIVKQAVDDYKKELHKLEIHPYNQQILSEISRLERFFHSEWYSVLTNLNPDSLLEGVRLLVRKETKQAQVMNARKRAKECLMEIGKLLSLLEAKEELSTEEQKTVRARCAEAIEAEEEALHLQKVADEIEWEAVRRV